jgi:hypothetical protein
VGTLYIHHATMVCHDGSTSLPPTFNALLLDAHGISTKTRVFIRREPAEPWSEPLGPWIEGLLRRKLTPEEVKTLQDGLYDVAGLSREDVERLDPPAPAC